MLLLTVNESRFACCLLGFRGKPATWIGCLSFQNNTNCFCFTWFSQSANKPKSVACFPTTGLQNSTSTFRIALCSLTQRYLKSWHRSVVVAFALHIVCDFKKKIFLRFFMKRSKLNTRIREENSTEYSLQLRFLLLLFQSSFWFNQFSSVLLFLLPFTLMAKKYFFVFVLVYSLL